MMQYDCMNNAKCIQILNTLFFNIQSVMLLIRYNKHMSTYQNNMPKIVLKKVTP